jgi:hypothetical protein
MLHNTQNYCVFVRCPSYGILNTRKHNVSETGSDSILKRRETHSVGSLIKSKPQQGNPCHINYS